MPVAGSHDAANATLAATAGPIRTNPEWASQPLLAVMRIPKLPNQAALMDNAFVDERFPHQPTRETLSDTIKLAYAAGRATGEQVRWLADNKARPNRLWSAISQLTATMATDADHQISRSLAKHLGDIYPLKKIAQFIVNWHPHLPNCIDRDLVLTLNKLSKASDSVNMLALAQMNTRLIVTAEKIATALNQRLQPSTELHGIRMEVPFGFFEKITESGALAVGHDIMEGLALNTDLGLDDPNQPYWSALRLALRLIGNHLVPLNLPDEVMEMTMMFQEEFFDDLDIINRHLKETSQPFTETHIAAAIHELEGSLSMIEDEGCYEWVNEMRIALDDVNERWAIPQKETTATLRRIVKELPAPQTDQEVTLQEWLIDTCKVLPRTSKNKEWWTPIEPLVASNQYPRYLDRLTPVFLEPEHAVLEALEDQHRMMMDGGCEDEDTLELCWSADPKTLLDWCDKIRTGFDTLGDLFNRLNQT